MAEAMLAAYVPQVTPEQGQNMSPAQVRRWIEAGIWRDDRWWDGLALMMAAVVGKPARELLGRELRSGAPPTAR